LTSQKERYLSHWPIQAIMVWNGHWHLAATVLVEGSKSPAMAWLLLSCYVPDSYCACKTNSGSGHAFSSNHSFLQIAGVYMSCPWQLLRV
jgi:hypothetical protein